MSSRNKNRYFLKNMDVMIPLVPVSISLVFFYYLNFDFIYYIEKAIF